MPRGDGTGPKGAGPGTGKGMGGRGMGSGRGTGIMRSAGPGGNCVCPSCGTTVQHQAGVPCNKLKCQKCGINMVKA